MNSAVKRRITRRKWKERLQVARAMLDLDKDNSDDDNIDGLDNIIKFYNEQGSVINYCSSIDNDAPDSYGNVDHDHDSKEN